MKQSLLSFHEILTGYDAVSSLYPHVPPLSMWRAWEYASYQRYHLPEPVLDIGCGDGRFFHLVWPGVRPAVGVDIDPAVAEVAWKSGIYQEVYVTPGNCLPMLQKTFASAFANCSLEHMDNLTDVLEAIHRNLCPGGHFLLSVVTEKLLEWRVLPSLLEHMGQMELAERLRREYVTYHHLINPLSSDEWMKHLIATGFDVLEHIPIVPEVTSRLFLFLDEVWHLPQSGGELGDGMMAYLRTLGDFPQSLRHVLTGVLQMEREWLLGSGAIFWARRRG